MPPNGGIGLGKLCSPLQSENLNAENKLIMHKLKKDQYFGLEVNLLNDDDVVFMMFELGTKDAMGVYLLLIFHLRKKDDYKASYKSIPLQAFAKKHELDIELVKRVIFRYNLFEVDEEKQMFSARHLNKMMKRLDDRMKLYSENGKKGGRPKKETNTSAPASKAQKSNQNQAKR